MAGCSDVCALHNAFYLASCQYRFCLPEGTASRELLSWALKVWQELKPLICSILTCSRVHFSSLLPSPLAEFRRTWTRLISSYTAESNGTKQPIQRCQYGVGRQTMHSKKKRAFWHGGNECPQGIQLAFLTAARKTSHCGLKPFVPNHNQKV